MKLLVSLLFSLFIVFSGYSENYKQIKIFFSNSDQITQLAATGIDLEGSRDLKENSITIFVGEKQLELVKGLGLAYQVLIDDWDKYYKSLPKMTDEELKRQIDESKSIYNVTGFVPN